MTTKVTTCIYVHANAWVFAQSNESQNYCGICNELEPSWSERSVELKWGPIAHEKEKKIPPIVWIVLQGLQAHRKRCRNRSLLLLLLLLLGGGGAVVKAFQCKKAFPCLRVQRHSQTRDGPHYLGFFFTPSMFSFQTRCQNQRLTGSVRVFDHDPHTRTYARTIRSWFTMTSSQFLRVPRRANSGPPFRHATHVHLVNHTGEIIYCRTALLLGRLLMPEASLLFLLSQ